MNNTTLTQLETKVLAALKLAAQDNGGDFAIVEEVQIPDMTRQAIGGVLTSLETKQVICVDITYVNNRQKVTQVTPWVDGDWQ